MQINKWVTLIFGAICLMAVASAMGAQELYYMAAILLTLPGVSYFFGWYALRGLVFERSAPPMLWAGEEAEIVCIVRNPSPTPRYFLSLQDSLPQGAERAEDPPLFNLGAGESSQITQRVRFLRRGVFTSLAFEASAMDPLGIFSFSKKISGAEEWTVYPAPLVLHELSILGAERHGWQSVARAALRGGSVEPDGTRRYVSGDPLRRIHWRQTARTGALSVIEYEEAVSVNITLAVDCNRDAILPASEEDTLEVAIRAAASLAQACLASGAAVGMMAVGLPENLERSQNLFFPLPELGGGPGNRANPDAAPPGIFLPPGRGDGHLVPVLDALARVESFSRSPFCETLAAWSAEIPRGSAVIALTADPDLDFAGTLALLAARGVRAYVILLDAAPETAPRDKNAARRDDFFAALLANGAQAARLRCHTASETRLETRDYAAA